MSALTVLEIPEFDAERPAWLEQQLVGTELGDLVQQLRYFQKSFPSSASSAGRNDLDSFLGKDRDAVLHQGLSVLGDRRLHVLLQNPDLLLPLQELVLIHGGDYWSDLIVRRSSKLIEDGATVEEESVPPLPARQISISSGTRQSNRGIWMWASIATAAMVLIIAGVALFPSGTDKPHTWGFNNSELLASDAAPGQYLQSLAGAANQWFNKPTHDSEALQTRLGEFSQGCVMLIAAKHSPLNDGQRNWLIEKCQNWKTEIDALQSELASGELSFEEGTAQADELVRRMITVLKTKAQQA